MTKSRGRLVYHLNMEFLKVLERSLHFIESEAPMISICVLIKATSSYGPLLPSNFASDSDLKLSGKRTPQISLETGWGSKIFVFTMGQPLVDIVGG